MHEGVAGAEYAQHLAPDERRVLEVAHDLAQQVFIQPQALNEILLCTKGNRLGGCAPAPLPPEPRGMLVVGSCL